MDKTPKEIFNAINNVRGWWQGTIEGNTDKLNDACSNAWSQLIQKSLFSLITTGIGIKVF